MQTRITGDVFTDASNTETPNESGTLGKLNGYKVVDFSADYTFLEYYNIRLSVNNVTNTKYATRRSGGYPGPGILPGEGRTFNLGIGIKL